MIRFTVFRKDETYKGFLCEGHAEYSEEGMDIVCAAVSALTVNTINSVEKLTEDPFAFEEKEEGGWLKLEFKEEPSMLERAQDIIRKVKEAYVSPVPADAQERIKAYFVEKIYPRFS